MIHTDSTMIHPDSSPIQADSRAIQPESQRIRPPHWYEFEAATPVNQRYKLWKSAYERGKAEIIRCKDCDWWTKQEDSVQGHCELMQMYPTGGWYCGNARRRGGEAE